MKTKITILFIFCFQMSQEYIFCQTYCGPTTPTFTVNLTGQPQGSWISPVIQRDDTCCGSSAPNKCLQFIITLDSAAQGISFNLHSGAVPPGAMFYQINCGPPITVGSPICLNGVGPHYLTFCKPGNNSNEYIITSLGGIGTQGDTMAMGCTGGTLSSWGYYEPSITWTSIFPGAQGAYNSYLSCTGGCDTVQVNPLPNSPAYIDFKICGVRATFCDTIPICDTVRVYIFSTLQVTVSGNTILCNNNATGSLNAAASGGAPPYSYSWSNGSSSQSVSGLGPGNYSVTVVDVNGCSVSNSTTIIQPPPLVQSVSQSDVSCFGGQNGTALVSPSGGTSPYTYLWLPCGCTSNALVGLTAGSYSSTVTDQNGCSVSQSFSISQPPLLTISVLYINDVSCNGGNNGQAGVSASGGAGAYTYQWSTFPIQTTSTATGLSAGTYSATITDSNGCVISISCNITQPAALAAVINSTSVTCYGTATGSATASASGGSAPYNYAWNPGGSNSSTVTGLSSGTYTVLISDMYGCTQMVSVNVAQPALLLATVSNPQHVSCHGLINGSASVNASGGTAPYNYSWNNGQTTSVATSLGSGIYTVVVMDGNGCTTSTASTISQPSVLLVAVSSSNVICPGQSANISANASGGTGPYTYFWQPNVGFGNAQTVSPTTTTTYTALVTDANGCTNTNVVTIGVHSMNLIVNANATPAICVGQTATVLATTSGTNITQYQWSHGLGNSVGPYAVSPSVTTTYTVTAFNICGASVSSVATVVVNPLPQIYIPPQNIVTCGKAVLHFSDTTQANNGSHYNWNFGDGGTSSAQNPTHIYNQTGVYVVSVTVSSTFGCSASAQTNCAVTVFPIPAANFTSDPPLETSIINPDFRFFDKSKDAIFWEWDFGDGKTSQMQNPAHSYENTGIYTVKLIVRNAGNCMDTILKTVEVKPEFTFYIPNTFTPNGDGINDFFTGKGLEIAEFEMSIFDRWGEEIFKSNNLGSGWDGTVRGKDAIAQEDVYVYRVILKDNFGTPHVYNGHVNLVK